MLTILCNIALVMMASQISECRAGVSVSPYGAGLVQSTVEVRVQWGHIAQEDTQGVDGYASSADCALVGTRVHVKPVGFGTPLALLVIDCPKIGNEQEAVFVRAFPYLVDNDTYALIEGRKVMVVGR